MGENLADWSKEASAINRVRQQYGKGEKKGWFLGREMIGRDKKINQGVYVGAGEREAIVVDDEKDLPLNDVYKQLLVMRLRAKKIRGTSFREGLLQDIFNLTKEIMPVDIGNVEKVRKDLGGSDRKTYLSSFFGGGVCRHQALLAGYLLERLKKEGKIGGDVSVDRNSTDEGGHAWVRYTNSKGKITILDPALNFRGYLKDVQVGDKNWPYYRKSDLRKRKAKKIVQTVGFKAK